MWPDLTDRHRTALRALAALAQRGRGTQIVAVARAVGWDRKTASTVLFALERRGLVTSEPRVAGSQRLTARGRAYARALNADTNGGQGCA